MIETDGCILRRWEYSDLDDLILNANNQKIADNLRDIFPFPYTYDEGEKWINFTSNQDPLTDFAIVLDDNAAGGIGLNIGQDIERLSAEVGYWLGEKYWGKGIASMALKGIVSYGFTDLGLERIYAKPFEHNTASRRVLEKNDFQLEGILRKSAIKSKKIYNQALYGIIR